MGRYSTAIMLFNGGADHYAPRGLFRNIWDSDELNKLVQNSETCTNTQGILGRKYGDVILAALCQEAAAQFEKMGQRSSAEEMLRRLDEELEERRKRSFPTRFPPLYKPYNQSASTPSQAVKRFQDALKRTSSDRLEESDADQIPG